MIKPLIVLGIFWALVTYLPNIFALGILIATILIAAVILNTKRS